MTTTHTAKTPPPPVYFHLREIALQTIEAFHADLLKHDRRQIRRHPGTPFIHATGKTGTNLLMLYPPDLYPAAGERVPYLFAQATREHILNDAAGMAACYVRNGRPILHYHDGRGTIKQISEAQAEEIISEYIESTRAAWRKADRCTPKQEPSYASLF